VEVLEFTYPAKRKLEGRAHVGVVGSGTLEVLLESSSDQVSRVRVRTSVNGFQETWKAVFDRFFERFDAAVNIEINDAGASPGVVMLRLQQAVEAAKTAKKVSQ
jgi:malonate decarboxylase delta subunit